MADSIDDRVVKLEFDNDQFEKRMGDTIASLDKLNDSLQLKGASEGLDGINASANGIDLSALADGVDNISSKFSAMGAIAFSALQKITQGVLSFIHKTGGDILGPVLSGGRQRALNLEQAKFAFEGLGVSVEQAMADALKAVKGTSFGLDEAAQAAGVFAGAGIKLGDQMQHALRGITGTAAITGKSFSEIATIFEGSAGTGVVNNMDLQQFATRGLNAAAAVGKVMGKTEKQIHEMASNGKLDFAIFADAMDKAFGAHATDANKTYAGSLANVHAAMSRLGATFFTPELTQQRDLFNALSPAIDSVSEALSPLTQSFLEISRLVHNRAIQIIDVSQFGTIQKFKAVAMLLGDSLKKMFVSVALVVGAVKRAFQDIFPKAGINTLINVASAFHSLAEVLVPSKKTIADLQRIFRGLFAALSIGWDVIKNLWNVFLDLESVFIGLGRGNILDTLGNFGDFFTHLQQHLKDSNAIVIFFMKLEASILSLKPKVDAIKTAIADFFDKLDLGRFRKFSDGVGTETGRISGYFNALKEALGNFLKKINNIWQPIEHAFGAVLGFLGGLLGGIIGWFKDLGNKIADSLSPGDFDRGAMTTAILLVGGIFAAFKSFDKGNSPVNQLIATIKGTFGELTNTLQAMQTKLKAEALEKIAIAIGILTASVVALSLIDSLKLTKALYAMSVGFTQLLGSFAILNQIGKDPSDAARLGVLATDLNILGTAILVMAGAIAVFGRMKPATLAKGIAGITAALTIMTGAAITLSKNVEGLLIASTGVLVLSGAMVILGSAMKIFGSMSWGEIARGLTVMTAGLILLGTAVSAISPEAILAAPALLLTSQALVIFGAAMKIFGSMSWKEIGKGLAVLTGGLVIIGAVLSSIGPTALLAAPALVITASALVVLAGVMKVFGSMKWSEIGKGLAALAGVLVIIGASLTAMEGALIGAVSLTIAAGALVVLFDVIKSFADLKTGDLIKALVGIAAALTVIGVAAFILLDTGAVIGIIALGYGLVLLGAGFALVGAGAYLMAKAFEEVIHSIKTLSDLGGDLVSFVETLGKSLTSFAKGAAQGAIEFLKEFLGGVPALLKIVGAIIDQLLDTLIKEAPKLLQLIGVVLSGFLDNVEALGPRVITIGAMLIGDLLTAANAHVTEFTNLAIAITLKFLAALTAQAPALVAAGAGLVAQVIWGLATNIQQIVAAAAGLIIAFLGAIQFYIPSIINAGVSLLQTICNGIVSAMPAIGVAVTAVIVSFIREIGKPDHVNQIIHAGVDTLVNWIKGISDPQNIRKITDAAAHAVVNFINGIADAIDKHRQELQDAGRRLASAVLDGITLGLTDTKKNAGIKNAFINLVSPGLGAVNHLLKHNSPSKVFIEIGQDIGEGLRLGLVDKADATNGAMTDLAGGVVETARSAVAKAADHLGNLGEFNPTITPVLDLTEVQSGAQKIAGFIQNGSSISPTLSIDQAKLISAQTNQSQDTPAVTSGPPEIKFEQTINAPQALSASDIYKQTRNQITMAKEELKIPS